MSAPRVPQLRLFATDPPAEPHRFSSRVVSLIFHLIVISGIVFLGVKSQAQAPAQHVQQVTFVDISRPVPLPPPPPAPAPPRQPSAPQAGPPKGFQTLTAPAAVPTQIPAPGTAATQESNVSGQGVEGGTANGTPVPSPAETQTYELSEVSVPPQMVRIVKPEYPRELGGIRGTVLLGVDVMPNGQPDPASLKVIRSLNPILDDAARQALLKSVFTPGYVAGRAVRVAVIVPYTFTTDE